VRGGNQLWFLDSSCSRNMTGDKSNFLSLTAFDGGRVVFENGKSGKIIGVGKIGKLLSHFINNVHLVDGLQQNLLSVSQLYDRGNHVGFSSDQWLITNIKCSDVVLRGKRYNNVCKACVLSLAQNHLTCLSALDNDVMLWHKSLVHASLSLLNKLVFKDQVVGLPSIKYNHDKVCNDDKVCDACARGKQVRTSFKSKNCVSTS